MIKPIRKRKLQHIDIVLNQAVEPLPSPFERYRLPYRCLPECNLADIDTTTSFLGKRLAMPLIISSMTGGAERCGDINQNLARAAEACGVALGLGSMRICLEQPEVVPSFQVRHLCPSVPLLANVGLVQLNYGLDADKINHLVELVEADGLYLHINPLQEAVQPEGDTNFAGLLARLEALIPRIKVPVLAKEVGHGIDGLSARLLRDAGVQWLDVAGTGGTSWSQVEGYRRDDNLGHLFAAEGIPTDEAILAARHLEGVSLIASGGVRSGLDLVKALMMGARLTGMAKPLLAPALDSTEAVINRLHQVSREVRTAMFACGATNMADLADLELIARA